MHAQAAILTTTNEASVVLTGVTADVVLTPGMTEVSVKQCYSNQESIPVEAVYTFPLPLDAVLLDMHVQLGDRTLAGHVLLRQEAESSYEDAIVDGDKAVMLQQLQPGLFTMNVGNLLPAEDCVISYRFTSLNRWTGNTLRFSLPSTIAPRFGDPAAMGFAPQQVPEYSMDGGQGLSITVRMLDALANARIASPTHKITIAKDGAVTCVSLLSETIVMDRDFVLNIDTDAGASSSACIAPDVDGWLVHTSFCPQIDVTAERTPSAVKLVLDCSGSMAGDSIAQGREALLRIVDSMSPDDYFSLLRFGSTYEDALNGEGMLLATDENKTMAKACIRMLDADMGGTEIAHALKAALQTRSPNDVPADLLLITDGNVWDHETSAATARRFGHRIFTVGVGSAVTESYVRSLAEETGGACELVSPNEDMADKIHRHFLRMNSPRCEDMAVCWDSVPTRAFPEKTRCVYDGDTVHLFHWFDEAPTGEVTIKLNLPDGRVVSNVMALQMAETQKDTSATHDLARVAAATIIRNVVDAEVGAKLALDYQLMSEWTNYLVTEQSDSGDKALQLPELRKVRSQVSAGWGGSSSLPMMSMELPGVACYESISFEGKRSRDQSFHSEDLASFLLKNDTHQHEDLIAKIKSLIASRQGDSLASLLRAELRLEDSIEFAIQHLISQGLDESLVVTAFLHYFVLGMGDGSFSRHEVRTLRKLYRAELAKYGLDPVTTGQQIADAFASAENWEDVVAAGFGNAPGTF